MGSRDAIQLPIHRHLVSSEMIEYIQDFYMAGMTWYLQAGYLLEMRLYLLGQLRRNKHQLVCKPRGMQLAKFVCCRVK